MYIDLVLCEQGGCKYLFRAPSFSGLNEGDAVRVSTKRGEQPAKVVAVLTVESTDKEKLDFIIAATNATLPIREVVGRYIFDKFTYRDKDEEQEKEQ